MSLRKSLFRKTVFRYFASLVCKGSETFYQKVYFQEFGAGTYGRDTQTKKFRMSRLHKLKSFDVSTAQTKKFRCLDCTN